MREILCQRAPRKNIVKGDICEEKNCPFRERCGVKSERQIANRTVTIQQTAKPVDLKTYKMLTSVAIHSTLLHRQQSK